MDWRESKSSESDEENGNLSFPSVDDILQAQEMTRSFDASVLQPNRSRNVSTHQLDFSSFSVEESFNKENGKMALVDMGHCEIVAPPGWKIVGSVLYNAKNRLGNGSMGTIVFRGFMNDGREVAVKRVLNEHFRPVRREVELLREHDQHPNIIRFFRAEKDESFHYLVFEFCVASLFDYVEKKEKFCDSLKITSEEIIRQSTQGIAFLHSSKIVHRDLKPENVLFSVMKNGQITMKICDFGNSKLLNPVHSSSKSSGLAGSEGWMAPEALRGEKDAFAMDIFSLGCIIYFLMTWGSHPYGDVNHRTSNIVNGKFDLKKFLPTQKNLLIYRYLITKAIDQKPTLRPSAEAILAFPLFWDASKKLQFFCDVSDRLKDEKACSYLMTSIEWNACKFVTNDWSLKLDDAFRNELRKYNFSSVKELLRAIRNTRQHFSERSEEVQNLLGTIPDEFLRYFTRRFPHLLHRVYKAMERCSSESLFAHYYPIEVQRWLNDVRRERMNSGDNSNSSPAAIPATSKPATQCRIPAQTPSASLRTALSGISFAQANCQEQSLSNPQHSTGLEIDKHTDHNVSNAIGEEVVPPQENWIGKLAEYCLKNDMPVPVYDVVETGPTNERVFAAKVVVGRFNVCGSIRRRKQESRADAARKVYEVIMRDAE